MNFIKYKLKKSNEESWGIIKKYYKEKKTKHQIAIDLLLNSINYIKRKNKIIVLDAGCGKKSRIKSTGEDDFTLIGIDYVYNDIKKNNDIDHGARSNLEKLPFSRESVDIIFCNMVVEHLIKPEDFFAEASRVLKKNGHLIISTPSLYNIVVIINRLITDRISQRLAHSLTGVKEDDTFKTEYKANTTTKILKLCKPHNLRALNLILYQPPPYAFVFSKIVCAFVILYYKTINRFEMLKSLRGIIIMRLEKY